MRTPLNGFVQERYPTGQVTQWFGENPALYQRIGLAYHNGVDYVQPWGSPMYAIEDATVVEVNNHPDGFGKHVRIISTKADKNGLHREWTYGHCSEIHVKQNDQVFGGQHIADMGNTGFVVSGATPFWHLNPFAGTHLHLGLRLVRILKRGGWSYPGNTLRLQVENYENGVRGAIDPVPHLKDATESPEQGMWGQLLFVRSLLNSIRKQLNV
jgi:murein DD-endopeptidase MepM/ murein hydrolase activator NlpD